MIVDYTLFLQAFGSILAVLGAMANCSPNRCDKLLGFGVWIISNSTLLVWSVLTQAYWLTIMYGVFMGTSGYGFWKHRSVTE